MSLRRLVVVLLLVAAALVAWRFWLRDRAVDAAATPNAKFPAVSAGAARPAAGGPNAARLPPATPESMAAEFPVVAQLNAPGSTLARDLDILQRVLDTWRSNFPREGNPVGDNVEITAALTGNNRLNLMLLPPNHPAINARGELCDRWGTPLFFHQLSGDKMELKSAGPDRKFGTADDALWSPEPR